MSINKRISKKNLLRTDFTNRFSKDSFCLNVFIDLLCVSQIQGIVGNSDMHLKNFSLNEADENSHSYIFSGAYDMLPISIVNPADTEETELSLSKKTQFTS